ncbi:hypothetical protein CLOSTMETH_01103 [[Clostridium] methylpentosum DSM 5476]|uniref:Uncharacterized protein n=1 Tax=[Clostridium] methylpentosum DSM 5476 TaxID=537013 RepID=C0EB86_9FIRM|nr:hypothetical protein CLOSTMETH_01103 [[Clostridium] methylpentosum DSM 5476]
MKKPYSVSGKKMDRLYTAAPKGPVNRQRKDRNDMKKPNRYLHAQRFEEAKALASHLMLLHYCDRDPDEVTSLFVPQFS